MTEHVTENTSTELLVRVLVGSDGYQLLRYVEQGEYWCIPEGFVKPGEHIEDAVRRTCREDLGIEIDEPSFACVGENRYRDAAGVLHLQLNLAFDVETDQPGDVSEFAVDGSRHVWVYYDDIDELDIRPAALWSAWRQCTGETDIAWVPDTV